MNKKIIAWIGVISSVVLAAFLFIASFTVTSKDEYTVIRRFGKIEKVISEPGFSFKVPFVENASSIEKRLLMYDIPQTEVITKDKKNMVVDCYVTWKIVNPVKFAQALNSSVTSAEARINSNVFNTVKNTIGSIDQNELISGRDTELSDKIKENIPDTVNSYGIEISKVEIKTLDLPADNKQAVYTRMVSERAEIAAGYTAEGDAESQKLINKTDKTIAINLSNANTKAEQIIAEGEKEYMRILNEAYSDPDKKEFYNFQLELNAVKKYMVGDKTLILPKDSPLVSLFVEGY